MSWGVLQESLIFANLSSTVSGVRHPFRVLAAFVVLTHVASNAPKSDWSLGPRGNHLDSFQLHKQLAGLREAHYKEELFHAPLAVNLAGWRGSCDGPAEAGGYSFLVESQAGGYLPSLILRYTQGIVVPNAAA